MVPTVPYFFFWFLFLFDYYNEFLLITQYDLEPFSCYCVAVVVVVALIIITVFSVLEVVCVFIGQLRTTLNLSKVNP